MNDCGRSERVAAELRLGLQRVEREHEQRTNGEDQEER